MVKFIKPGKVILLLRGRFAGRKAVIVQQVDSGSKFHPFGHAVAIGIDRYPRKVTRRMGSSKVSKRSKIKPFIKLVNYNHIMVTRYTFELETLKGIVTPETFREPSQREEAKKAIKRILEERYLSGKNRWFFTPIRF
ncbi:hypothetical protein MERGE_002617 [Pneumocystis wakefieldiae]|uniref:60S ribosomal protein L27 n=1 Tax=Pneumocystis wakefieldiae TaxID=38082 RepID=A0A899G9Q6_9ASCO|nr:hypothetical protein MERGE_002617 [Pneumocystis wakefieldiae]